MAVQSRQDYSSTPFILQGSGMSKTGQTLLQDAGRSGDLVRHTLMSFDPSTAKWVPFTDETATDGTQIPTGIIMASVTEASIVAGDVLNIPILVRGVVVDKNALVIENSKTLATIVNVPTSLNKSVEELLRWTGIFMQDTTDINRFEN